jgi:hypothetical protein
MHECAELLVQLFCSPEIGIFIYFQAMGTEPPLWHINILLTLVQFDFHTQYQE